MCGIAGMFGQGPTGAPGDVVERMSAAIAHRGPDDAGYCELGGTSRAAGGAFAHRRLAILDLSACGHQPMAASNGRQTIVFNGEIYNFAALRESLQREGARFRGSGDTEVLLEGWARHGPAFLPRLRGMFAFALWDEGESCGYLVRDAFGIKPLYVAEVGAALLFASELRALLASGVVPRRLSRPAIAAYLAHGAAQEPLTLISGVTALPPGTVTAVRVHDGRVVVAEPRPFATALTAASGPLEKDPGRAATLVRAALADSVAHHLVSDVPVALFLSGGIDSSALVALASEVTGTPLQTFTITFGEAQYSEAGPAAAVARRFRTEHHEIPLGAPDLLASLPEALAAMDQPSLDGLNTYAVSSAVRRAGYKVVLSGLGGDELFAGYPSFRRAPRLAALWRALGTPARGALSALADAFASRGDSRAAKLELSLGGSDPAAASYAASRALFAGGTLRDLLGDAAAARSAWLVEPPQAPAGLTLLQRVSWYELTGYMRNTLLRDSDVFSMSHGLELRVPFVDSGVAAASTALDDATKLHPRVTKPLLVAALGDLLPREVWDRPKRGFELPFAHWLRRTLRGEVEDLLASPTRLARVGLQPEAVREVWQGFLANRRGMTWSRPWALFALVRWAEAVDASVEEERHARVTSGQRALRAEPTVRARSA